MGQTLNEAISFYILHGFHGDQACVVDDDPSIVGLSDKDGSLRPIRKAQSPAYFITASTSVRPQVHQGLFICVSSKPKHVL